MSNYLGIDTAIGSVRARIKVALVKQAALRAQAAYTAATAATGADPRERSVCTAIIDGTMPDAWVMMVLIVLDVAGFLATVDDTHPTDAQIDQVIVAGITTPVTVASVWSFLIATR